MRENEFLANAPQGIKSQRTELFNKICVENDISDDIEKCISILQPINDLIVKFQSDAVLISDVYHEMTALQELAKRSNRPNKKERNCQID
jgi:hypothetical protein